MPTSTYTEYRFLEDNDYTLLDRFSKGIYQSILVTRIDEYAIPNKVYGVLYSQNGRVLGVDWYPGEEKETVLNHTKSWIDSIVLEKEYKKPEEAQEQLGTLGQRIYKNKL